MAPIWPTGSIRACSNSRWSKSAGAKPTSLSLTLHNHDGQLKAPETGRYIRLALGWESGDDVTIGLVDKGAFRVDEVEESGPPDKIQIRARSADFTGPAASAG
jgi:phage protein D